MHTRFRFPTQAWEIHRKIMPACNTAKLYLLSRLFLSLYSLCTIHFLLQLLHINTMQLAKHNVFAAVVSLTMISCLQTKTTVFLSLFLTARHFQFLQVSNGKRRRRHTELLDEVFYATCCTTLTPQQENQLLLLCLAVVWKTTRAVCCMISDDGLSYC